MRETETEGKRRTKCPLCGGEIEVSTIYQYSCVRKLTKNGRIAKRYSVVDGGDMEVSVAGCRCGACWDTAEFLIDEKGYFIDYKYKEG